jgi:hypothetical protein
VVVIHSATRRSIGGIPDARGGSRSRAILRAVDRQSEGLTR